MSTNPLDKPLSKMLKKELIQYAKELETKDAAHSKARMSWEHYRETRTDVEVKLKEARNRALSIVNTPNFSEMHKVWASNRKAMYSKYYDMFKSYSPNGSYRL